MTTFNALGIASDLAAALAAEGITEAFPIQEQTIPIALTGQDIIGQAKTGTGKTFGFGLPLLQRIGENPAAGVQGLVIVPTRELAVQVYEDLALAASGRTLTVCAIYGGKSYEGQVAKLRAGAQVVVGTPGRILDLVGQRLLNLAEVREVVLDEADKMLDLGFLPDIEKIFSKLPASRHTMLFSATMPGSIITLARRFMRGAVHIRATAPDEGAAQANIEHIIYRAHALDKDEVIGRILQAEGRGKTVIFMRTKRAAAKLLEELRERGFNAAAVHGDLDQERRERAMSAFKSGKKDILIATDVAARGIDVDDVTHVINHTVPDDEKTYLHRVGRTGRAGRTGVAVTFVDWEDLHKWALIDRALGFGIPEPRETYSSSPHLYEDLHIPAGAKGRLPRQKTQWNTSRNAAARDGEKPQRTRNRRRRGGSRANVSAAEIATNPAESAPASPSSAAKQEDAQPRRRRRRRRTGGARGKDAAAQGTAQQDNE